MKIKFIIILSCCMLHILFVQSQTNLVLNPSLEDTVCCPISSSKIHCAEYWHANFPAPFLSSTEYYHLCGISPLFYPTIPSRTGVAMAGFYVAELTIAYREYVCGHLYAPLDSGRCYNVQFYLLNTYRGPPYTDTTRRSTGVQSIGIAFSIDSLLTITPPWYRELPYQPQVEHQGGFLCDTVNWMPVRGSFIAQGGEKHFCIGSFKEFNQVAMQTCSNPSLHPSHLAYYYLDDVSVWPCDAPVFIADAGKDKPFCFGDKVTVGNNFPYEEYSYLWSSRSHSMYPPDQWDTLAVTPHLTIEPTQTTTYYLQLRDFKFDYTYDSVTVFIDCLALPEIPNVFTPNGDGINDYFEFKEHEGWELKTQIYNRWGKVVFIGINDDWWDGNIQGQPAAEGVYYYSVTAKNHFGQHETLQGSVSLLR